MNLTSIIPDFVVPKRISKEIVKETKNESFAHVQQDLGDRQRIVFEHLRDVYTEGATAKELSISLYKQGLVGSPERNSVHPRLNELVEKGLVSVVGKKTCQFTGRLVAIYKNN